jgi:hypothetical protein
MNYKKIYKQLIDKAKSDIRSKKDKYYEKHHIIPDFMFIIRTRKGPAGHLSGNPNDKHNLVLLTPREHLLSHILLYKILMGTHYEYSAGSSLSFFLIKYGENIGDPSHPRLRDFRNYGRKYEKIKQIGNKNIARMNSNFMNVKHKKTGEYFGRMAKDDPRIIAGEFVHHSSGKHKYKNIKTGEERWLDSNTVDKSEWKGITKNMIGMENSNALKSLTKETAIKILKDIFPILIERKVIQHNELHTNNFLDIIKEKLSEIYPYRKTPPYVAFMNRFDKKRPVQILNEVFNLNLTSKNGKQHAKNNQN